MAPLTKKNPATCVQSVADIKFLELTDVDGLEIELEKEELLKKVSVIGGVTFLKMATVNEDNFVDGSFGLSRSVRQAG